MATEAKFRVGDVVRVRGPRRLVPAPVGKDYEPRWRPNPIPAGVYGVIKRIHLLRDVWGNPKFWTYSVAIPPMRYYPWFVSSELEFIEHQPSSEEIAAMYAEAT